MKNRKQRVALIIDMIRNRCISSQEELGKLLAKEGFNITQATLSRDLKLLKTTKVPTDRGYMYVLPDSNSLKDKLLASARPSSANFMSGFMSIHFSKNIVVIKTRNGYATGLAYDIDMSRSPEILGTVPGSDTIIAVMKEDLTHDQIYEVFRRLLPLDDVYGPRY